MTMTRAFVLGVSLWALGAGTGCVFWPHQQQRAPEVQGVLQRDGAPVANVPVRLWVNPRHDLLGLCKGTLKATTDEAGRFLVPRTTEHENFIVMGDRRDVWQLCFELPGQEEVTWLGSGWWGGPKVQTLVCEAGPPQAGKTWAMPPNPGEAGPGCRELPEVDAK